MKATTRIGLFACVALAVCLALLSGKVIPVDTTLASWGDPEYARSTFTAGVVLPPQDFQCAVQRPQLVAEVRFSWTPPADNSTTAPSTHYDVTLTNDTAGSTNPPNTSATLPKSALEYVVTGIGPWPLGTRMIFKIVAVGPSPWLSTPQMKIIKKDINTAVVTCTPYPEVN